MKTKLTIAIGIVAILIAVGIVFFNHSDLRWAQTPHSPGKFIPKEQLAFVGFRTPEAALESFCEGMIKGDYDTYIAAFTPSESAEMKKENPKPERFKSEVMKEYGETHGVEIMARKNLTDKQVELKFQITHDYESVRHPQIAVMVKIGNEWKLDFKAGHTYSTNWDNSDGVITYAAQ
jgi:hypothetical protein